MTYFVHSSSCVDEGAVVGSNTKIWHFSHVMSGAEIGADCVLGQNVFVASGVIIGSRCRIQNNVSLFEGVELEEDVFCGPGVVFTNVRTPRANISRKGQFQKTRVARGATLGANSTIVCGVSIGPWAFIAAGAVVTRDVLSHALVAGNPARKFGWACTCGLKLDFSAGHAVCKECRTTYEEDTIGLRITSEAWRDGNTDSNGRVGQ